MPIKLVARATHSTLMMWVTPLIALALSLIFGGILFQVLGYPPLKTLHAYFISPISDSYGLSELFVKASPLAMIAIGLALGFRANVWNIGAEGQLTLGAITGSALVIYSPEIDHFLALPAILVLGILGGAAWGAIPAFLKIRFNTNEILSSLMLVYVAGLLLSVLIHGPWRDPAGFGFPESVDFPSATVVPQLVTGTRLHAGTILALLIAATGWVLLSKTWIGFQVKIAGQPIKAARYAGVHRNRVVWWTLVGCGGTAGLAGIIEVAGPIGQLQPFISPGYGFAAIIVAFLGRLHPAGIIPASLVLALSYLGGESVQIKLALPIGITGVFQGMLLFFLLACDLLVHYKLEFRRANKPISTATQEQ